MNRIALNIAASFAGGIVGGVLAVLLEAIIKKIGQAVSSVFFSKTTQNHPKPITNVSVLTLKGG